MSLVVAVDDVLLVLVDVVGVEAEVEVEAEVDVKLVALEFETVILLVVPAIDPAKEKIKIIIIRPNLNECI